MWVKDFDEAQFIPSLCLFLYVDILMNEALSGSLNKAETKLSLLIEHIIIWESFLKSV